MLLLLLTHQLWYLLPKQLLKLLAGARVAAGSWHQPLMLQGAAAGWHQLPLLLAGTSCRYCWLAPTSATAAAAVVVHCCCCLALAAAAVYVLLLSTCCYCMLAAETFPPQTLFLLPPLVWFSLLVSLNLSRETLAHCPAATNTPYKSKVCVARGEEPKRCC